MENRTLATRTDRMWEHIRADQATRQIRKEKKDAPKEERVRQKGWVSHYGEQGEAFDDLDLPDVERVVPLGEQERRRANLARVTSGSLTPSPAANAPLFAHKASEVTGTVIEVSQGLCRVSLADGELLCEVRRALKASDTGFTNIVAVGDEVLISRNGTERGMIEAVTPRRSALARPDPFYAHLRQVIVANVDQVLIVAAWREPAFWPELVDRYLIAAARNGLAPIICLNKVDLAEDPAEPQTVLHAYSDAGYTVLLTSAQSRLGVDGLRRLLWGRTTALAGLSGVGKSSLLSAVEPGLHLRVGEVSDRRHEGRHTTTQASLHRLAEGGFVVDTPGIREFGLSGLRRRDLADCYPEIARLRSGCQFEDCTHTREPGCAVRLAVRQGRISPMRFDSYRKILASLPA
jgi:ribosome biogenesis GTPase / thiamine phosphate phosphatase